MRKPRPSLTVAFCHCKDCQPWTGSPAPAFAAFAPKDLTTQPPHGVPAFTNPGVSRWNFKDCGSPLAAALEYIPDQIYVPLGLIDQADQLIAEIHCFSKKQLPWLHIEDNATRGIGTARDALVEEPE